MSAFALLISPANLSIHLQRLTERSATTPYGVRSFGTQFEPRYIFRAGRLDQ
jgi:hypothetical protein